MSKHDLSEEIRIRHKPFKLVLIALGSLVFVIGAIPIMMAGIKEGGLSILWATLSALLDVVFFGACFLFAFRRLFLNPIALTITKEGFDDCSAALSGGFVKWSDIASAFVSEIGGQKFLSLVPRDVEGYLAKQPPIKQKVFRANVSLVGAPINISTVSLDISLPELLEIVQERLEAAHGTRSPIPDF